MHANTIRWAGQNIAGRLNDIAQRQDSPDFFEGVDYLMRNSKIIANCQNGENWGNNFWDNTAGTYAVDTTNFLIGSAGAKGTTSGGGGVRLTKSMDLTKYDNYAASGDSDKILMAFHISAASYANLGTSLIIAFPHDAAPTYTNNKNYTFTKATDLVAGWNYKALAKSSFTTGGGADWSTVTGFSWYLSWPHTAPVSITFGYIILVAASPTV